MKLAIQEVLYRKNGYNSASKAYNVPQTALERQVKMLGGALKSAARGRTITISTLQEHSFLRCLYIPKI